MLEDTCPLKKEGKSLENESSVLGLQLVGFSIFESRLSSRVLAPSSATLVWFDSRLEARAPPSRESVYRSLGKKLSAPRSMFIEFATLALPPLLASSALPPQVNPLRPRPP